MAEHLRLGAFTLLLLCSRALPARAQEIVVDLPSMLVSANRMEQLREEIPATVGFLDSASISSIAAADVTELLSRGLNVELRSPTGNPGNAEVSMRGFTNGSQRVLVLVDGHRVNRPDMGAVNWLQIPVGAIESIEVLRGPWTALYGNNAVGGVIKITTRKQADGLAGMLDGYIGESGLRGGRATLSAGADDLSVSAGADSRRSDGWRDHSAWSADSLFFSLASSQAKKTPFEWAISAYATDSAYEVPGPLLIDAFLANPRQALEGLGGYSQDETATLNASLSFSFNESHKLLLASGLHYRDLQWELGGANAHNELLTVSLSPHYQWQWGIAKGILGLDFNTEQLDFTQLDSQQTPFAVANLSRDSLAPFLFTETALTESLSLSFGLRWETNYLGADYFPVIPNPNITPFDGSKRSDGLAANLGLLYHLNKSLRFWARADRLFRIPAVDEVAAYQGYDLEMPFNFSLEPEEGWNFELGSGYRQEAFSSELSLFFTRMEGEIYFDRSLTGGGLNTNLPNTERFGIEFNSSYEFHSLSFHGSWRWIATQNHLGGAIPLVPAHYLTFGTDWRLHPRFTLGWSMLYQTKAIDGEDFSNTYSQLPPYALHELHARWSINSSWEVYLQVDNLFDRHYASLKFLDLWYPGNGRIARVGARFLF